MWRTLIDWAPFTLVAEAVSLVLVSLDFVSFCLESLESLDLPLESLAGFVLGAIAMEL